MTVNSPHWTPAPPKPKNGFGGVGFILGLLAAAAVTLTLLFFPPGVFGTVPFAAAGIIFSVIGFMRCRRHQATNPAVSLSGLILSAIALVATAVVVVTTTLAAFTAAFHLPAVPSDAHQVEFVVTTSTTARVGYGESTAQHELEIGPGEWRQQASYETGSYFLKLEVQTPSAGTSDKYACTIYLDGKVVTSQVSTDFRGLGPRVTCFATLDPKGAH